MTVINFLPEFAGSIINGRKRQTIRKTTKARAGGALLLCAGKKGTGEASKLKVTLCSSVQKITLMKTLVQPAGNAAIVGIFLEDFAKADGFKTYADMWAFFAPKADANGEFHGYLIRW